MSPCNHPAGQCIECGGPPWAPMKTQEPLGVMEWRRALAASQAEVSALKKELETHANQEVAWKLALDALKVEREGLYGESSYKMLREQHELACAEVSRLTAELAAETRQHADTLTRYDEACDTLAVSLTRERDAAGANDELATKRAEVTALRRSLAEETQARSDDFFRLAGKADTAAASLEWARLLLKRSLWMGGGIPGDVRTDSALMIEVRAFLATGGCKTPLCNGDGDKTGCTAHHCFSSRNPQLSVPARSPGGSTAPGGGR